jgi:hypothetical protein
MKKIGEINLIYITYIYITLISARISQSAMICILHRTREDGGLGDRTNSHKTNSMAWVRRWTILTERTPLVGEISANVSDRGVLHGQCVRSPSFHILCTDKCHCILNLGIPGIGKWCNSSLLSHLGYRNMVPLAGLEYARHNDVVSLLAFTCCIKQHDASC